MPTLSSLNLPTPKSWEEFEEITLDALRIKWDSPNLQKNGRAGQPQKGVDIYGDDYLCQHVGVQCKKYDVGLTEEIILKEIENAEGFDPEIKAFFIATTAPTDATLQKKVRLISKDRVNKGKFPVGILFWNDIVQEIVTNEKIFKKHFPQISLETFQSKKPKRLFSILDLSYRGLTLKLYSDIIYGEMGLLAGEDPRRMEVICAMIESACVATCSDEERIKIIGAINHFLEYLIPYVTGTGNEDFHWKVSNDNADRVSGLIKSTEHSLQGDEMLVYRIGELIGNWDRYEWHKNNDETPVSNELLDTLTAYITKLNSGQMPEAIEKLIQDYKINHENTSKANIAGDVYLKMRQLLRDAEILQ
jgi:hypothetical protein